jgi:hypothetical protein
MMRFCPLPAKRKESVTLSTFPPPRGFDVVRGATMVDEQPLMSSLHIVERAKEVEDNDDSDVCCCWVHACTLKSYNASLKMWFDEISRLVDLMCGRTSSLTISLVLGGTKSPHMWNVHFEDVIRGVRPPARPAGPVILPLSRCPGQKVNRHVSVRTLSLLLFFANLQYGQYTRYSSSFITREEVQIKPFQLWI